MSTNQPNSDYSVSSLDYVVVNRDNLLSEVKANKEKHTQIYHAACSGYWVAVENKIIEKKQEFSKALHSAKKQFQNSFSKRENAIEKQDKSQIENDYVRFDFNNSLGLTYPVHHFDDYDRVIKMLEFSVSEKIKLSVPEFEKFARNNWDWKEEFCSQGQIYLNNLYNVSGCCFTTGSYLSSFLGSGAKAF